MQRIIIGLLVCLLCGCAGNAVQEPHGATAPGKLVYVGSEALPVPLGVDPGLMDKLAAELERVLAAEQSRGTTAQTTDYIIPRRYNLNGDAVLSWEYNHTGDYNQDGLVSVNDITPIGQNYNAAFGAADWASAWLADGNGDGLVTVNDITPIGQNYQDSLRSYVIEAADSAEGPWAEVGRCPFEAVLPPAVVASCASVI